MLLQLSGMQNTPNLFYYYYLYFEWETRICLFHFHIQSSTSDSEMVVFQDRMICTNREGCSPSITSLLMLLAESYEKNG